MNGRRSDLSVPRLQARSLADLGGVRHAFFTRVGGISRGVYESLNAGIGSGDTRENVAENRARMAAALGLASDRLINPYQVHSPVAVFAQEPWASGQRPRADAVVTTRPGLAISVTTADCGPVLLADAQARVIAAVHAGWRGALAGVLEAAVDAMEQVGAARERIAAAIGPTIRQPNYEVGPELIARFLADAPSNTRFFGDPGPGGHARFDLPGYIAARLSLTGVESIEDLGCCTYAEPDRFFSYRRTTHRGEPDFGRHLHAIVLAE